MRTLGTPGRRLFFAFWPDEPTREAMLHAARKVVRGSGGRPVVPGNLHMTMAFLGFVPETLRPAVSVAGQGLPFPRLDFTFDGIDFWPKPRVLVATASEPDPAGAALAAALWARLLPLGLKPDSRPFSPHVTLARKVRKPASGMTLTPVPWPAPGLALVESVTHAAGARYRVLERFPLQGPAWVAS